MPILDWLNKTHAVKAAQAVPYRLLEAESVYGDASADNWLIQGDNLEALKSLLPTHAGRVKCIYIDPPYNTRSAFEHYDDNLEHSQWLTMIYPRLELLRELLAEDGSIWVSIDDNEAHYLKVVMDEVFGRGNFIANVIWQKKYAKQNDAQWLSTSHDHLFVYGKRAEQWRPNKVPRTEHQLKGYKNPDNDPRGPWQSVVYTCAKTRAERPNLFYAITHPQTGTEIWPSETRVWAYDQTKHKQHVAENRIWWGLQQEKDKPRLKSFLREVSEGIVPDTLWLRDTAGDNQDSKREMLAIFGSEAFTTPKPEKLIQQILQIATNPNDLVLDSFLGSGTTAAVAHKMGRRWIGIEMGEHARSHCLPRLEKVVAGEQGGISETVGWQGGGGFRFFRLGQPVFLADGGINPEIRFPTLAAWVWYQETRTPWAAPSSPALLPQGEKGETLPLPSRTLKGIKERDGVRGNILGPLLGIHEGTAYYLLYNGILGDRRPQGGNVLTSAVLAELPPHDGPKVIYGESCRLSVPRLAASQIRFKQIPYDIRAR